MPAFFTSPLVLTLLAVTAAAMAFAFWKGGTPERLSAAIVSLNMAGAILVVDVLGHSDGVVRFASDGLTALLLLVVAVRFGSPWMIGVMFFYAAQFSLHAYYMMTGRNDRDYLHALINNIDNLGVIACLTLGTAVAWRQRVRTLAAAASPSPGRRR